MIDADFTGSYRYEQGSHDVLVGVIDTGIEANHPDIAPNFNRELSRNFTVDDPVVDGPCEEDPDQSCEDPADVDEGGPGTHVAGTIGAPLNQIGIGGVAPASGSSTSAPARTQASSSCSRRSTRSRSPATTASMS